MKYGNYRKLVMDDMDIIQKKKKAGDGQKIEKDTWALVIVTEIHMLF